MTDYNPRHRRGRSRADPIALGIFVGFFISLPLGAFLTGVIL